MLDLWFTTGSTLNCRGSSRGGGVDLNFSEGLFRKSDYQVEPCPYTISEGSISVFQGSSCREIIGRLRVEVEFFIS